MVGEDGNVKEERDVTDVHPEGDIRVVPFNMFVVWEFWGLPVGVGGIRNVEEVHDGCIPSASCGRLADGWVKEEEERKEEERRKKWGKRI